MFNIFLVRLPNIYFFYIFVFCGFAKLSSSLTLALNIFLNLLIFSVQNCCNSNLLKPGSPSEDSQLLRKLAEQ